MMGVHEDHEKMLNTRVTFTPFAVFHGASYSSRNAASAYSLWLDSFHVVVNLSVTWDHRFVRKHKLSASPSLHMSI